MKRVMRWTAAVLCASLLLTGCGAKNSGEGTEAPTTGAEETEGLELTELPDYTWDGIEITDYVKLGAYEGIEYQPASTEISDDEVDELIEKLRESTATSEKITEGTVKDGDTVNIDYVGKTDGVAFEGGTAKNQTVTIGVTSMIPGFLEGIVDQKIGSDVVLDLKFPEDYWNKDMAGKDAEFTITINYVAGEKILPEVTDTWADTLTSGEYKTVKALRDYLRQSLKAQAESSAAEEDQLAIWDQVYESATVTGFPEGALDYYYAAQKRQMEMSAAYYNMDFETMIKAMGYTMETIEEKLQESAEKYAGNIMVARALVKALGQEVTEAEYEDHVKKLAEDYSYDDPEKLVEAYGGKLTVLDDMILGRAIEFVQDKAVAKTK